jgi:hypothetical protein
MVGAGSKTFPRLNAKRKSKLRYDVGEIGVTI